MHVEINTFKTYFAQNTIPKKKEMYLTSHSTHFISQLYDVGTIPKVTIDGTISVKAKFEFSQIILVKPIPLNSIDMK